ncbi:MAG: energy transducer TonB, partial [Proteobacteria bacterium]|nr:energy transducer TonB [Pseudomonadota bacterium]
PPRTLAPPTPTPLPPPPEDPPIIVDDPSPIDVPAPPPSPPSPPAPANTIGSVDASSRAMNPPRYPPAAVRSGIEGTVILVISIDAQGNVLNVEVERSSRNRDLDRSAIEAARRWRFNPAVQDGQQVASRVRVPVDFSLGR